MAYTLCITALFLLLFYSIGSLIVFAINVSKLNVYELFVVKFLTGFISIISVYSILKSDGLTINWLLMLVLIISLLLIHKNNIAIENKKIFNE